MSTCLKHVLLICGSFVERYGARWITRNGSIIKSVYDLEEIQYVLI